MDENSCSIPSSYLKICFPCCLATVNFFSLSYFLRLRMCAAGHPFFFSLTSCGPPTNPGSSRAHCTCRSASVLLLLSLEPQAFCGLASPFRLFCILVLDGQCTVGAWRAARIVGAWCAARTWCACCLGEPRARASVMNIFGVLLNQSDQFFFQKKKTVSAYQ